MASIDYTTFLEDMMKMYETLKDVYTGKATHEDLKPLSIADAEHIKFMNMTEVPQAARVIYGNAYDHMRAFYRALQVTQFTRNDLYGFAAEDTDKQRDLYTRKYKVFVNNSAMINDNTEPFVKERLEDAEKVAQQYKAETIANVRSVLNIPPDIDITSAMVIAYENIKQGLA